jgi:hypothetical protein
VLRALLADATPLQPSDASGLDPRAASRFLKFVHAQGMYLFTAPFSSHLMRLCDPHGGTLMDTALQDDCRAVGALMALPTANELMQGFGLRLQERLAADPAAHDAFARRASVLTWRLHADEEWFKSTIDAEQVEEEISILLESASETERRNRQLALHGCTTAPPPGWTPSHQ